MRTNAMVIAKKDFSDAIRAKSIWLLIAVFVVVSVPQLYTLKSGLDPSLAQASRSIGLQLKPVIPLVSLLVGYKAVVGERESGSLRILLGLPGTRFDVLAGKIAGRAGVFLVVAITSMAVTGLVIWEVFGGLVLGDFILTVAFILLFGLSWLGIAIGVSSAVESRFRAVAGSFGLYAIFAMLWNTLVLPIAAYVFTGSASTSRFDPIVIADGPNWYLYFQRLNPTKAFEGSRVYVTQLFHSSPPTDAMPHLFGIGSLILWFIVPLLIGYWRFERADLG